ncbi:hypothetical protein M434DRAFT_402508 [Hypoxylon sp. CO27-5]|nr:hypothetical protein M434DRAFT_402508 [Hypoxylon sp. CO27-5]
MGKKRGSAKKAANLEKARALRKKYAEAAAGAEGDPLVQDQPPAPVVAEAGPVIPDQPVARAEDQPIAPAAVMPTQVDDPFQPTVIEIPDDSDSDNDGEPTITGPAAPEPLVKVEEGVDPPAAPSLTAGQMDMLLEQLLDPPAPPPAPAVAPAPAGPATPAPSVAPAQSSSGSPSVSRKGKSKGKAVARTALPPAPARNAVAPALTASGRAPKPEPDGIYRHNPCSACVRSALTGKLDWRCKDPIDSDSKRCFKCASGHSCRKVPGGYIVDRACRRLQRSVLQGVASAEPYMQALRTTVRMLTESLLSDPESSSESESDSDDSDWDAPSPDDSSRPIKRRRMDGDGDGGLGGSSALGAVGGSSSAVLAGGA